MAFSDDDGDEDDYFIPTPIFNGEKYYYWKDRMVSFLIGFHYDVWEAIEEGPFVPTHIVDGVAKEKPKSQWTDDDKKKVRRDMKAKHFILGALSYEQFGMVSHC
jgi:hypothetical protein